MRKFILQEYQDLNYFLSEGLGEYLINAKPETKDKGRPSKKINRYVDA